MCVCLGGGGGGYIRRRCADNAGSPLRRVPIVLEEELRGEAIGVWAENAEMGASVMAERITACSSTDKRGSDPQGGMRLAPQRQPAARWRADNPPRSAAATRHPASSVRGPPCSSMANHRQQRRHSADRSQDIPNAYRTTTRLS